MLGVSQDNFFNEKINKAIHAVIKGSVPSSVADAKNYSSEDRKLLTDALADKKVSLEDKLTLLEKVAYDPGLVRDFVSPPDESVSSGPAIGEIPIEPFTKILAADEGMFYRMMHGQGFTPNPLTLEQINHIMGNPDIYPPRTLQERKMQPRMPETLEYFESVLHHTYDETTTAAPDPADLKALALMAAEDVIVHMTPEAFASLILTKELAVVVTMMGDIENVRLLLMDDGVRAAWEVQISKLGEEIGKQEGNHVLGFALNNTFMERWKRNPPKKSSQQ